jgi:hypothetical protein
VLLIGFATGLWLANGSPPASTTTQHNTTSVAGPDSGGGSADTPTSGETAGNSQTTVDSVTTSSGGGTSGRSETLVIALFGLGALMLLCGIFFGRIQEVTLPGGTSLKLSEDAQAKVAAKVADEAKTNPQLSDDPQTIKRLYQITLDHLTQQYQAPGLTQTAQGYYVAAAPTLADISDTTVAEVVSRAAAKLASKVDS